MREGRGPRSVASILTSAPSVCPDGADLDMVSYAITVNMDVVPMPMFAMPESRRVRTPSVRNLSSER